MVRTLATLACLLLVSLPGCSKTPAGMSGSSGFKLKDPVWTTFGWSKGRMIYVIYFVPNSSLAFNPDGVAATVKAGKDKEGDSFEGGLDGYVDKSKAPFKASSKNYDVSFEGKTYRTANGAVFLVKVGTPSKVEQLQATFGPTPKDADLIPEFMENEVRRLAKENPKIGDFPKEPPPPDKPDKTKKK